MAHCRGAQAPAQAKALIVLQGRGDAQSAQLGAGGGLEDRGCVRGLVRVDSDDDHLGVLLVVREWGHRGRHADFQTCCGLVWSSLC